MHVVTNQKTENHPWHNTSSLSG